MSCLRSALMILLFFVALSFPLHAQEVAKSAAQAESGDPENRHTKLTRYTIPPQEEVAMPKLNNESVVICLEGELIKRTPGQGATETWEAGPGRAIWNRSGVAYWFKNESDLPVKLVVVEVKDFYGIEQQRVPASDYDPVSIDPRHYSVVFENEGVRLLRLHLDPREEAQEVQFPFHLQIALRDVRANILPAVGKVKEEKILSGVALWKTDELRSVVNLEDKALDEVILEWKHPFCYSTRADWGSSKDDPIKQYMSDVYERLNSRWRKVAQKVYRQEKKGLVAVFFKVQKDGTILEDDIKVSRAFADSSVIGATLGTIRAASPLAALPPAFTKPQMGLNFSFFYNLPQHPAGCDEVAVLPKEKKETETKKEKDSQTGSNAGGDAPVRSPEN